ncbi:glucose-1-phosphate adenylyltransferase subunit GlgD [Guggenheimella bovis]
MKNNVLGVINLGEREDHIRELTLNRPIAAIPFGGRYRIIDFMLSNMVHSGIDTIAMVLNDKFHSLNDHIGPGKQWDLDRKTGGLRMLYPDFINDRIKVSVGDINQFHDNIGYFERTNKEHILLTRSNYIANIDFTEALTKHEEDGNDVTVLTRKVENGKGRTDLLGLDMVSREDGRVSVGRNLGNQTTVEISIEMYIIKKEVFLTILREAIEQGTYLYFKDALLEKLRHLKAGTFEIDSDVQPITSTQSYYNASMQLLDPDYAKYLFYKHGKIYTKVKDAPSTIYLGNTSVENSLIANGCIIKGVVENCVLFRGVKIGKNSVVRNSILFQDTVIGENCQINNCIFDKNVEIADEKTLMGVGGVPYVLKKGVIVR